MPEDIKEQFIKILEKIQDGREDDFTGVGLLLYDSSQLDNLEHLDLRPSAECPSGLSLQDQDELLDFLSKISSAQHFFHEGYHFFNEEGELTHISQYLIPPYKADVIPHEQHGARYLSGKLCSLVDGVIYTGMVGKHGATFYFDEGKPYRPGSHWNDIYKEGDYSYYDLDEPHEDLDKVTDKFKEEGVEKVLDLGCGSGRNLIPLAEEGFDVSGIDASKEGIEIAHDILNQEDLEADLETEDVFEPLPYADNSFDAVVSVQVLQHGSLNQIKHAIEEIKRILRPGGLIFVTLCGRRSQGEVRYCLVKTARKIAPRTYVPTIGKEEGLIHYIYNKEVLKKHYKDFEFLDLWQDSKDYYCLLGQLPDA